MKYADTSVLKCKTELHLTFKRPISESEYQLITFISNNITQLLQEAQRAVTEFQQSNIGDKSSNHTNGHFKYF